jgi:hypothetical protein
MIPEALTTTVLTHPIQVLAMGVILFHLARAAISAVAEARPPRRTRSESGAARPARPSHLRAA